VFEKKKIAKNLLELCMVLAVQEAVWVVGGLDFFFFYCPQVVDATDSRPSPPFSQISYSAVWATAASPLCIMRSPLISEDPGIALASGGRSRGGAGVRSKLIVSH